MQLIKIVGNRLVMLIFVMFAVSIITFAISRVIPGDPALLLAGPRATPELLAQLREDLGLDAPLIRQYWLYISDLLRGDLGTSIMSRRPVTEELFGYMPATFELMLSALVLSLLIGIPLGVITAMNRNDRIDVIGRSVAILGISAPSFWLAIILILIFYGWLGLLPGSGRLDAGLTPPPTITGLYLIDGALAGDWLVVKSAFNHLLLPAFTLSLTSVGVIVRLVRASMIEVMNEDYIRTARAYGVPRRLIIIRHALPNALMPFVTVLGLQLAELLFGSVIVESIFAWPGVGSTILAAVLNLDFPMIMGFTVLASCIYVLANLLVDLTYLVLDPRMREGRA